MTTVISCIDGSPSSAAVCDYSAWASVRLAAPLTLVHILEETPKAPTDFTGSIGLGSREHLLQELAELDEKRGRLAREHGQHLLEAAKHRLDQLGIVHPKAVQRHGNLVDSLKEMEDDIRLLVIGRQGESAPEQQVGSQLESVIRILHRPIGVITAAVPQAPASLNLPISSISTSPSVEPTVLATAVGGALAFVALATYLMAVGKDTGSWVCYGLAGVGAAAMPVIPWLYLRQLGEVLELPSRFG